MESVDFVEHFRSTFPDLVGEKILIALSGGRDSVALLHLLREPSLQLNLEAVHVQHGLRGAESDSDADFCRELCRTLEISCPVIDLPTDDERPASGEAAWRRRRYRALLEHGEERAVAAVATAHHRDDVAEGVLVQLLRGAGPRAMAGIEDRTRDGVIRPLLPWTRSAITSWLEAHRIDWRDDSSNSDTDRLRNRVRHRVLPSLEEKVPRLRDHLVSLAGAMAETEDFMSSELHRRVGFVDPWDPGGGIAVATLHDLPRALRSRWLHGQARRIGIDHATRSQLALFHLMLDGGSPRSVTLAGRWRLRSARGRVWAEPPEPPPGAPATLTAGVPTSIGVPGWVARISSADEPHPGARWHWNPRSGEGVISLRPAREGDRVPVAPGKVRRVRKLLAERLPRHLRIAWPLFCENDMIHWIPGVWQHPETGDPSNRVVEVIRQ